MEKAVLQATRRSITGKQVGALRRQGKLPAIIYGRHIDATPITLDLHSTSMTLSRLTSSSIITIDLEGTKFQTLVREKQRNYIKGVWIHLDFQAVSESEKIRTNVVIEVAGVAPAVKDFNGVLVTGITEIEVECLPQDLPERIIIDISGLKAIGDGIFVRDLAISEKVHIHHDSDDMLAVVTAAVVEEEVVEETSSAPEPEIVERGKKEEVED
jgi:large subunit ribosomal protein L25